MVSKAIQQLMKQAIRFYAERTARAHRGWMKALQMHWQIAQVATSPLSPSLQPIFRCVQSTILSL